MKNNKIEEMIIIEGGCGRSAEEQAASAIVVAICGILAVLFFAVAGAVKLLEALS